MENLFIDMARANVMFVMVLVSMVVFYIKEKIF